jgi:hypothetical protein
MSSGGRFFVITRASEPVQGIYVMYNQAHGRGIRTLNQALTHIGGEQGSVAVLDCF